MTRVWVTRAQPGADATAQRLRNMGLDVVVAPLLEVRALAAKIDLAGVGALAFTSGNGVRAFAAASPRRDLPVYAVGDATAAIAVAEGFADVTSAGGDVSALASVIANASSRVGGVLHLTAASPAGDLAGLLGGSDIRLCSLPLYETVPTGADVDLAQIDAVLLHSPRAAGLLADHLRGSPAPHLVVLCISAATAAPLRGHALRQIFIAPLPNETAMLSFFSQI